MQELSAKLDRNFASLKTLVDGGGAVPTLCFIELAPKETSLLKKLRNPSMFGDKLFHQRFRLHFLVSLRL